MTWEPERFSHQQKALECPCIYAGWLVMEKAIDLYNLIFISDLEYNTYSPSC